MRTHDSKDYTKEDILTIANEGGGYIPTYGEILIDSTLDGSNIRTYLEKRGFKVIKNYDTGNNGLVTTAEGIQVSTNGYCSLVK